MANIITNLDLETALDSSTVPVYVESSVVSDATYLFFQAFLTDVSGRLDFEVKERIDSGDFCAMTDDRGKPIIVNTVDSVEKTRNIQSLVGDSDVRVDVKIYPGATGTLNVGTSTDGSIA